MDVVRRADRVVEGWGRPARQPALTVPSTRVVFLDHRVGVPGSVPVGSPFGAVTPSSWRFAANGVATFVLGLAIGVASLSVLPVLIGYRPVALSSGSMKPSLDVGDVVVTNPDGPVHVASVIDFDFGAATRIHRVVEVLDDGYRTKGDNNQSIDTEPVAVADVRGVGVFVVPFAGLPRLWFAGGDWLNLTAAVLVLSVCAYLGRRNWIWRPTMDVRHGGVES